MSNHEASEWAKGKPRSPAALAEVTGISFTWCNLPKVTQDRTSSKPRAEGGLWEAGVGGWGDPGGERRSWEEGYRNRVKEGKKRIEVRIKMDMAQKETWEQLPSGQVLHSFQENIKGRLGLGHPAECWGYKNLKTTEGS